MELKLLRVQLYSDLHPIVLAEQSYTSTITLLPSKLRTSCYDRLDNVLHCHSYRRAAARVLRAGSSSRCRFQRSRRDRHAAAAGQLPKAGSLGGGCAVAAGSQLLLLAQQASRCRAATPRTSNIVEK